MQDDGELYERVFTSPYPAFSYKVSGVVENSEEKSREEEINLCKKLVEDATSRQSFVEGRLCWLTFNNPTTSVLQGLRNPMCGLVALCMGAQLLRKIEAMTPEYTSMDVLNEAVKMRFSKQGEMFSVYEMCELAENLYACQSTVIEGNLDHNRRILLQHMLRGHPVLVPYDNDRNFEPCLKNGHKAHWALLTGAVVGSRTNFYKNKNLEQIHHDIPNVYKVANRTWLLDHLENTINDNEDGNTDIFVYAKQGKSAKHRLWSLNSLSRSNENLFERDPTRNWEEFHCPDDLKDSLAGKFIILHF